MIEINLLPDEFKKKPAVKIALPEIPARRVLFAGIGVFLCAQLLLALFAGYQSIELGHLKQQYTALSEQNKEVTRLKNETEKMQERIRDIRTITERKFYWASLLNALSDSMIKGVWLRDLTVGEGEEASLVKRAAQSKPGSTRAPGSGVHYLKLQGSVVSGGSETAAIGRFIKELKINPGISEIFDEIELSSITARKIKDIDVYDFVVICFFKKGMLPGA